MFRTEREFAEKSKEKKDVVDASLVFMDVSFFPVNFSYACVACCWNSCCWVLKTWRVSSVANESWFAMAVPAPPRGVGALLTSAACTGATCIAGSWWCGSNSSKGSTEQLKHFQRDFIELYLVCWQMSSFLRSALRIHFLFRDFIVCDNLCFVVLHW